MKGLNPLKNIYLVRHCSASGQHKDSPLTNHGIRQAYLLADFFQDQEIPVDRIISSPYLRAIESIKPYAQKYDLEIEIDYRLNERILSTVPLDDWIDILEHSFKDTDFKLSGGESSNDAVHRVLEVLEEIYSDEDHNHIIIITHGNLLALLLNYYNQNFGFDGWRELQNPDLFLMNYRNGVQSIKRLFKDDFINKDWLA